MEKEFFQNYTRMTPVLPRWVWIALRVTGIVATLAMALVLAVWPSVGLRLFWGLVIPVVPFLLVIAPGIWRQVCPMAAMNQLPRTFGFSRGKDLPPRLRDWAFAIALVLFIGCVALRVPVLNREGPVVAGMLVLALMLPLAGGAVFKGRSGWCGTFCPLGPIQRVYGQAPVVVVRNGYCDPCLGCQKNCYDFNPRAAVFSDVFDDDPRYAGQRRLFMGLLPGLILGYFTQTLVAPDSAAMQILVLLGFCCASAGLYSLFISFTSFDPYRISVGFGALALAIFYYFAGPIIVGTLAWIGNGSAPAAVVMASQGIGLIAALVLVGSGLRSELQYRKSQRESEEPKLQAAADTLRGQLSASGRGLQATDRGSGATFDVPEGVSLLEAIQSAGLKINYGCRAGVCGADAVAVLDGADNLSPPGPDELATLRRLGLEGKARLACVCQVKGPVLIDRDAKSAPGPAAPKPAVLRDRARESGVGRVVIIGNGVAGTSTAEALRRDSTSLDITLVTNEPSHFYNRMAIGRLVYGASGMDGMQLIPDDWYAANDIKVLRNTIAQRIDRDARLVHLATGESLPYDRLVLATGARSTLPEPDFLSRRNAFVLRTVEDAQAIRTFVQNNAARRALVIGGGVLGVEAADALNHLGLQVILLQRADRLMNMQLEPDGAQKLTRYLDGIGIQTVVQSQIARFSGEDRYEAAWLDHGPRIRADLFVSCIGITTNNFLARQAGLEVARGVRVNDYMQTSDPAIYAVGDVAELPGAPGGLWPVGAAQAATAAAAIYGETLPFKPSAGVLRLKCDGIDVFSYGDVNAQRPGLRRMTSAEGAEAWWTLCLAGGEVTGGQFVGPPGSGRSFTRMLQAPADRALIEHFLTEHGDHRVPTNVGA